MRRPPPHDPLHASATAVRMAIDMGDRLSEYDVASRSAVAPGDQPVDEHTDGAVVPPPDTGVRPVSTEIPGPAEQPGRRACQATRVTALEVVVTRAAELREALQRAGSARVAAYAARGQQPFGPLTIPEASDASPAAIATAIRAHVVAREAIVASGADLPEPEDSTPQSRQWRARRHDARRCVEALITAEDQLPRRDRQTCRMITTWFEIALDRWYYHQPIDPELDSLEDAAWDLVAALPQDRCPASAPRRLARAHRAWSRRTFSSHRREIDQFQQVAREIRQQDRAARNG